MSAGTAPDNPHASVVGLCEQIRGALDVYGAVAGPAEVARLVAAVAELTVLPGVGALARAELHTAAAGASTAAVEWPGTDTRARLAAVRAGCRRAAVAVGLRVPVACEKPEVLRPAPRPRCRPTRRWRRW